MAMDRTTVAARIAARVVVRDCGYETPCWISDRATNGRGYTKIYYSGRFWFTHRLSYAVHVGEIPDGLVIDHLCRERACCNPDHLEAVTHRTNLLRGETVTAREAQVTHCPRGHVYDDENTYRRPDGLNKRDCRTCRNRGRG